MPSGARPPRLLRLAGLALLWPGANPASAQSRPRPPQEEMERFPRLLDRYRDERIAGDPAAPGTLAELERAAERLAREFGLEGPAIRVHLYRGFSDEALREDRRAEERIGAAYEALSRSDPAGAEAAAAEAAAILHRIDNPDRLAVAENVRAKAAYARGDYASAAGYFREAIPSLRRVRSRTGEALLLGDLGRARAFAGEPGWRASFEEAMSTARSIADPGTEAEILARRGEVLLSSGEPDEALRDYREALGRWGETDSIPGKARALLGVAEVHLSKGELTPGLAALGDAESLGGRDPSLARTIAELRSRAAFRSGDDPAGAARSAERALELAGADPLHRARALVVAGVAATRAADTEKARARFEEAVEGASLRFPWIEAKARHNLGVLAAEAGEPLRAAAELDRARAIALRIGDDETLASSLALQAAALLEAGERDGAIEAGLRAWKAFEPFFETPATDWGRDLLFERKGSARVAAETTIRALVARREPGDLERAFEIAEGARARSLLGDLRGIGIDPSAPLSADLRARREECLRRYRLLCTAIQGALDAAVAERLGGELERVTEAMAEIAREARGDEGAGPAALEPASFPRARSFVSSSRAALLLYFLGERDSFLFALGPAGLVVRALPPRGPLEAQAETFLAAARRSALVPQARRSFPRMAKAFGEILLPPDLRALLPEGRAVVVPDGALEEIPFEAISADGKGAAASPTFSYAPSCAVLLEMARRASARASRAGGVALLACNASGAPRLSFGEDEVAAVAGTFAGSEVVRLEGAACRKEALLDHAGDTRVLHLLLHGEPRGERLGLRFSPAGGEEGVLLPHEVYGLRLSPDLVVLSGCSTARGKRRRGAGIDGLAHAFVLAGASRIVISLWEVDDEAAARTMEAFYAAMRDGKGPAEALAEARRRIAKSAFHGAPFHWAPFILIGPP